MENGHKDVFAHLNEWKDAEIAKSTGMYPYFRTIEGVDGNQVICEGRRKIMIGSNNYLGLACDPRVLEASQDATRRFGAGCTGSRFLNGTMTLHEELEAELADFLQKESVLLFSTGFFVNQGALATLLQEGDAILCDRENHASIIDGCNASLAKTIPFAHNSADSLRRRLNRVSKDAGKLMIADGVFSMSGDLADLKSLVPVCEEYGARVYIDEAHSLGVFGPNGEGATHHFGMNDRVDLIMGTFSKSLGSMGGFLAGPSYVIEYLKHKARCFIFTASLAPAVVGGVLSALKLMRQEPERRESLWKNARKMHEGFRSIGFDIGTTESPIVPLLIGSEAKAFKFTRMLYEAGIFTTPAVYPAVRYGQAIVRTSYMASHTDEELDYVLETCERVGKTLGIFEDAAYTGEVKKRRLGSGYDFSVSDETSSEDVRAASGEASPTRPVFCAPVSGDSRQNIQS